MKKQILLVLALLTVYVSSAQKFQDTIPFRNDLGLIIIPISFNGVEKQFAFDTGAEHTVAYDWAENELKKTNKTLTVISSSNLRSKMHFYKSGTINLGSRKITGHKILSTPKNHIFSCHEIDGILGVDIIKALNWKIDYKNKMLIMYPSNHYPESNKLMHELDFTFSNNRPYVYLRRKKNRFKFLLDTGAGGYSNISKRNYNLTNADEFIKGEMYTGSFDVNGVLTTTKPKILAFPESTSSKVFIAPIVYYNNLKSSKLGNKLWKDQTLFLSLKNKKLLVSSSKINQSYTSYECSVIYQKGKMVIMGLLKNGPLWNLGIRQGDEVLKVDGKTFTDFCSLDQYQRKIMSEEKPFSIQLKNGKTVNISKL
jgi:hypothetical protein